MTAVPRHLAAGLCLALLVVPLAAGARAEARTSIPEATDWGEIPHANSIEAYDPLLDADFDEEFDEEVPVHDPFEPANRLTLGFNQGLDRWVLKPITRGYRFVVPEPARQGIRRALINLNSPSILVNDLLQLRFAYAGQTVGRFVLNSTLGIGGLFDVGVEAGWKHHSADFGQTLAKAGIGAGPYLVMPVLGPMTLRDGVGNVVDVFLQPLTYLVGPTPVLMIGTGRGIAEFDARSDALQALEESSVDYYAALRSAYLQSRRAKVAEADDDFFDSEVEADVEAAAAPER